MTIQVPGVPGSTRKPGKYFAFNTVQANHGLPENAQRMLVVAQRLAAGTVAALVPTAVFSDADAALFFGAGSVAHLMVRAALRANRYLDLTVIAQADADLSAAATGSVTIAGPATGAGSVRLYVGNERIEVAAATGDTAVAVATALKTAMDALPALPVTYVLAGAVLNFTAKNKGTLGNDIPLAFESDAAGVTASAIVAMHGGAVDPDMAAALAVVFAADYQVIAIPFGHATTPVTALTTHLEAIAGPMEQRGAIGVLAQTGALGTATTFAATVNDGMTTLALLRGTRSLPLEVAAAYAAVIASEQDPAMPLNTLELTGIAPPDEPDELSRTEQESCLHNGVTPLEVVAGKVRIVRAVSTYLVDAQNIPDDTLLDITTFRTLFYARKAWRQGVALKFPRAKRSDRVVAAIRDEILDIAYRMQAVEILQDIDRYKAYFIVEKDPNIRGRVNAKLPAPIVDGLHVFAAEIDLYL